MLYLFGVKGVRGVELKELEELKELKPNVMLLAEYRLLTPERSDNSL